MLKVLGITLIISLPSIVVAAPIYLDCVISGEEEALNYSVKLDESSGRVTHTWTDGSAFNSEGFFSANTISYQEIMIVQEIKITMRYEINRSTLMANRQSNIEALNPEYASLVPTSIDLMKGTCTVVNVEDRKI